MMWIQFLTKISQQAGSGLPSTLRVGYDTVNVPHCQSEFGLQMKRDQVSTLKLQLMLEVKEREHYERL